jgi:hypothetical protein
MRCRMDHAAELFISPVAKMFHEHTVQTQLSIALDCLKCCTLHAHPCVYIALHQAPYLASTSTGHHCQVTIARSSGVCIALHQAPFSMPHLHSVYIGKRPRASTLLACVRLLG